MKTPIRNDDEVVKLERAISSKAAVRILRLLSLYPNEELSTYRIVTLTRVTKKSAKARLPLLVDSGLVKKVGRGIITYRFNAESKVARALRIFFAESGMI
ncbi:MAG: hypothetical protein HY619_04115 [Thaumarchaeota archaeon]|nr:hypothetical protein [Nitrososphaerota archaeon]